MFFTFLLLLAPLSWLLIYWEVPAVWIFTTAVLAIIPLAEWIRRATEQMAQHTGAVIGGLLNITFGNIAELVLALFVLRAGHAQVVKATITGSIISNSLFGLGAAILVGSWGREKQTFQRERAGLLTSLLLLSVIALLLPALFDHMEQGVSAPAQTATLDEQLSLGVAIVLILVYAANLVYTLVTHRDVFTIEEERGSATWSWVTSLVVLGGATVIVAIEAHLISAVLEATAITLGLSTFFLGVIVLPLVGNAAELFAACSFARQDRMGLVMGIAVGSSIQVALLTAPLLVLLSYLLGHPMNLVFSNPLELVAMAGVAFVVNSIAQDGETTWFEGLLLLAVYGLFTVTFFFLA